MKQTIEILVTPEGQTSVQTLGFVGPSCRDASRFLEKALGRAIGEKLTAEFHQSQPTQQNQHHRS